MNACHKGGGKWPRGRANFRGNWRGWRGGRSSSSNFRGNPTPNYNRNASENSSASGSHSQGLIDDHFSEVSCPYKGWKYYFSNEVYHEKHPLLRTIRIFESYFMRTSRYSFSRENLTTASSFVVDLRLLFADEEIRREIPDIECEVINSPVKILSCLGQAMHQLVSLELEEENLAKIRAQMGRSGWSSDEEGEEEGEPNETYETLPMMRARLVNMEPEVPLRNLKASYYEKFVTISGTVIRVGNIRPRCVRMAFTCGSCGHTMSHLLPDGKYTQPSNCLARECRGRFFTPARTSPLTELADHQTIRLQELSGSNEDTGRVPRTIECELMHDLVDSCVPGDEVTVAGIIKMMSSSDGTASAKQDKGLFLMYVQAHSLCNHKRPATDDTNNADRKLATSLPADESTTSAADTSIMSSSSSFSRTELERLVQEVRSQRHLFRLLVASLCPAIFGHVTVKAGLLLGLFGGTRRHAQDRNRVPVRGDPHVLVVGDPGLGKSQMLRACADVSPRGVYVCGNTTTTSGLTVTLTKEGSSGGGGTGDCGLEAGALVLSDQGCCCIDEFDKMGAQHQALLEAMEQQCISIAKAGIVCNLPARASVLAAANPVGGHYNKAKTVSENLKMGSALLSRFDLVFILIDRPDEEIDRMLSKHVMATRTGISTSALSRRPPLGSHSSFVESDEQDQVDTHSLRERLMPRKDELLDIIPQPILKAYIGYARSKIHPCLSPQAATLLQNFYVELRKQHQGADATPVTTRQLESMIRLSEARARCELREVVTEEDASDVIEIMKYSMIDTYSDQYGTLDFQRSQHGSGMSGRSLPKKFIAILTNRSERTANSMFTMQQLRDVAKESNMRVTNFEEFIESLNNQGFLLKKGPKLYKLNTV